MQEDPVVMHMNSGGPGVMQIQTSVNLHAIPQPPMNNGPDCVTLASRADQFTEEFALDTCRVTPVHTVIANIMSKHTESLRIVTTSE